MRLHIYGIRHLYPYCCFPLTLLEFIVRNTCLMCNLSLVMRLIINVTLLPVAVFQSVKTQAMPLALLCNALAMPSSTSNTSYMSELSMWRFYVLADRKYWFQLTYCNSQWPRPNMCVKLTEFDLRNRREDAEDNSDDFVETSNIFAMRCPLDLYHLKGYGAG